MELMVGAGRVTLRMTDLWTRLPFAVPLAVSVYVVVVVGWTLVDALAPNEPTPLSIETAETVGLVDQASVDDWPEVIVEGVAVNEEMQPPPTSVVNENPPSSSSVQLPLICSWSTNVS